MGVARESFARAFRRVLLDRVGELVEVGVERTEEPRQRVPANAAYSALDAGDECSVSAQQVAKLALGQPGVLPEHSESAAERELVTFSRWWIGGSLWPNCCILR